LKEHATFAKVPKLLRKIEIHARRKRPETVEFNHGVFLVVLEIPSGLFGV
jgi:hypothetical protein